MKYEKENTKRISKTHNASTITKFKYYKRNFPRRDNDDTVERLTAV